MRVARRYLSTLFWAVGLSFVLVGGGNFLVDPYNLFGSVNLSGFNAVKVRPEHDIVDIKAVSMLRMEPSALILGNSRAEIGLDPSHPVWQSRSLRAYNGAVPGSELPVAHQLYSWMVRKQPPKVLVLGVDFQDFLTREKTVLPAPVVAGFDDLKRARLAGKALFSVTGLSDSMRTLALQRQRYPESARLDGFNPLLDYEEIARQEGYYALFRQRAEEGASYYVKWPRMLFAEHARTSSTWNRLSSLLQDAVRNGTEVKIVIYPYHAELLALYENVGLWPLFEQWKEQVVQVAGMAESASTMPGLLQVWDFSGFSDYQCEAVPGKGDKRSSVQWYWEGGHFKKALGDLMLERMFVPSSDDVAGAGFGTRLTSLNLAQNSLRISQERQRCKAVNPAVFAEAAEVVGKVRRLQVK